MKPPQLSPQLTFLIEHLDLEEAMSIPGISWEAFQLSNLNNTALLAIDQKSRQVGWSWTAAADAVACACIEKNTPNIFVSINQDEAGEKVRYAKQIIEALDHDVRPKLIIDNRLELEFANGSRLISHPCRPVRGKARARVYLDEYAHYPKDREIYQSALPVISKGGVIRIGSSPLGASGMFWEIFTQSLKTYPGYSRHIIPWWSVAAFCTDVKTARLIAPTMNTEERVYAFGKRRLQEIYENMLTDDFQQEYECMWIDEAVAWIDWNLIKRNQILAQEGGLWYRTAKTVDEAMQMIEEVAEECTRYGGLEKELAGGMDVGRKHDLSEIFLVGKSTTSQLPLRLAISLDRVEFDDQFSVVKHVLDKLPVTQFLIDMNGLGMQLAEDANRLYGDRAQGFQFTNPNKELLAVEAKLRCQRSEAPIPLDREIAYQIHSIKKVVTAAKNNVFDTTANEKHHADKFWAWALALWAAKSVDVGQTFVQEYA
ncbi:MAG: terminase family protein [Anaerolineaceae bacterium]|nr:terminase family protein [Anaerolineaceae bacterium]